MTKKALQYFSKDYLKSCQKMTPTQIAQFLDDFRQIHGDQASPSKLISLKVPENLLKAFKRKAEIVDVPYQTQIKRLMKKWL